MSLVTFYYHLPNELNEEYDHLSASQRNTRSGGSGRMQALNTLQPTWDVNEYPNVVDKRMGILFYPSTLVLLLQG